MGIKGKTSLNNILKKISGRQIIEMSKSDINPALEVVKLGDRVVLNSSNANYSFGGLHRVFQKVFKKLKVRERGIRDVLILGFGAGSIPSILQDELGMECSYTAVEIDPEVIRLGRAYFDIGRYRDLELFEEDAVAFMERNQKSFDLVIVDVYIDFEVPESCETAIFVNDLARSLKPGGMILFNKLVYNHEAKIQVKELHDKFKKMDGNTQLIKVKDNVVNRIIVYET